MEKGLLTVQNIDKRATRAIIHLDNLIHNLECIRGAVGPGKKICIAIKADAYGHGAVEVSRAALEWGVDCLAVATVSEAAALRNAGIDAPIILFSLPIDPEIPELVRLGLTPFVGNRSYVEKLSREAVRQGTAIKVHLKIDTGMGRIGVEPDTAADLAAYIYDADHLLLEGVCTHLPVSDSPEEEDIAFTKHQAHIFTEAVDAIKANGIDPGILHAANSGAIISHPETHFDMVRPGICLYGYYPDSRLKKTIPFKPVMEMITQVVFLKKVGKGTSVSYGRTWYAPRDTWIATVSAGYADGYNRLLSSKGRVHIKGKSYPVAGRICMDQFMVDLGPETDIGPGDSAVLFGPGPGAETAEDLAAILGTIPYEVTCNINNRVPRYFTDGIVFPGEDYKIK